MTWANTCLRVVVCGSRTWKDSGPIRHALEQLPDDTIVMHGGQVSTDFRTGLHFGADFIADVVAKELGLGRLVFRAEWERYGPKAGPLRNQKMLCEGQPHLVYAFRVPGISRGTDDCARRAERMGIPVIRVEALA